MTLASSMLEARDRERLLVVDPAGGANADWIDRLRGRYVDWNVQRADSYLSAIADLCRTPARAVLARVGAGHARLTDAVAGLRQAAGAKTKLILCCTPDAEPLARQAVRGGADDYLVVPLDGIELDAAMGIPSPAATAHAAPPAASLEELSKLAEVLATMSDKPMALLEKSAELVRIAMGAEGASIVVQGSAATSGSAVIRPVLTAALVGTDGVIGQLAVTGRVGGPYALSDAQKLNHYAAVLTNVLAAASEHRSLRRLVITDECSGLFNRRYLRERLGEILAQAETERFPVTVLLFDLDDFKSYNDQFGHLVGDEIIRGTGGLFRKHCREQDIVTRYGGDEFAVIFWDPQGPRAPGSKHPEGALAVLERFKTALATQEFPRLGPSGQGRLTISGGLATFPWDGTTIETLLSRADEALLAAKRAGKNRIHLIGDAT